MGPSIENIRTDREGVLNNCSKRGCVNLVFRLVPNADWGKKNPENVADVLYGWSQSTSLPSTLGFTWFEAGMHKIPRSIL